MRAMLGVVLTSGLLVACGGGGGDAGTVPPPQSLLAINATNQDAVGRATATATTAVLGAGGGVAPTTSSASALSGAASAGRGTHSIGALARYAAHALTQPVAGQRKLLSERASAAPAPLTIAPETIPCSVSGSLTVTIADADNNNEVSAGDTMTFTFNQCREAPADSINGSMAVTLSRFDIVNGLVSFAGTLAMQQLSAVEGARTSTLNGSLGMTYTTLSTLRTQFTLVVGAAGLSASVNGGGLADSVMFEPDFTLNETVTLSTALNGVNTWTSSLSGGFSASSIGGRVLLEAPVPLVQMENEAYPRSGTMRVVGTGSALRLQALSATMVRIELDANLDGTYEASKDVAWTTLLPG
jgi:hypothetical protein